MAPSKRSSGKKLKRTKSALKHRRYEKNLRQRLQNGDPAARGVVERRQEWQRQYQAKVKLQRERESRSQTEEAVGEEIKVARPADREADADAIPDGDNDGVMKSIEPARLLRTPTPSATSSTSRIGSHVEHGSFKVGESESENADNEPTKSEPEKPAFRNVGRPLCWRVARKPGDPMPRGAPYSVVAPSFSELDGYERGRLTGRLLNEAVEDERPVERPRLDTQQRLQGSEREKYLRARLEEIEREQDGLGKEEVDIRLELRQLRRMENPE